MRNHIGLGLALVASLTFAACQKTGGVPVSDTDMALGNPAAKVTVVEYASLSCPFCAKWYNETFPAFKAKYIDTGAVHFVTREALTGDPPEMAAAGFLLARCAGKDRYFKVMDAIYHAQEGIIQSGLIHDGLRDVARSLGFKDADFEACITDSKGLAAINARWEHYVTDDKINSTPTFVINGKILEGTAMKDFDAAIAAAKAVAK